MRRIKIMLKNNETRKAFEIYAKEYYLQKEDTKALKIFADWFNSNTDQNLEELSLGATLFAGTEFINEYIQICQKISHLLSA